MSNLTADQQALHDEVLGNQNGEDLREVLRRVSASAEDKAAVADVLGGPGAGDEFRGA